MGKDIDEIVAMERRLWSSANDPKVYEQVIADGGISVIEPMGVVEKQQAVAMSAKGKPFRDVKITDLVVREFAPDNRLADEYEAKYAFRPELDGNGLWLRVTARVAYAWLESDYQRTATRFVFD